jgi:YHS domain-containing protein
MRVFFFSSVLLVSGLGLYAQGDDVRARNFNIKKSIALEGYDPVSYFDNKPAEGKTGYRYSHHGITYLFSTESNLAKFKASPEKYEPVFGGWCAYAMGESGEKVKVDPETYKIFDGKLYLFYNFWGNNTLNEWNKNEKTLKAQGDANWKKFIP